MLHCKMFMQVVYMVTTVIKRFNELKATFVLLYAISISV
jgi:hypothetical protein